MVKLAVFVFAALAIQAAFGGVYRQWGMGMEGPVMAGHELGQMDVYAYDHYDVLYRQLLSVVQDLDVTFQGMPADEHVFKTLVWQSRELAHYIDYMINNLQTMTYHGEGNTLLMEFIREMRQIQASFQEFYGYADVPMGQQWMMHFYTNLHRMVEQIGKLMRMVQIDLHLDSGFHMMLKHVMYDFLYYFQNIYNHFQYFGMYGKFDHMQLVGQIRDITGGLVDYLQGYSQVDSYHFKFALRQYVHYIQAILARMDEMEATFTHPEMGMVFQQLHHKLRSVYVTMMQLIDGHSADFHVMKMELVRDFEMIAQYFQQLAQFMHTGTYETFFHEILGDYFYAIQQFRYYVQPGYQGMYGFQGYFDKHGLFGKYGYKDMMLGGWYGMTGYQNGFFGKYHGFGKYGMDMHEMQMQLQVVVYDLFHYMHTMDVQDMGMMKMMMHLMREYVHELEFIVEWMDQAMYTTDMNMHMYKGFMTEMKEIVFALKQVYSIDYTAMTMTMWRDQYMMYFQKFFTCFQQLCRVMETQGTMHDMMYTMMYKMMMHYMQATYYFYFQMQHMMEHTHAYALYGFQPFGDNYYFGSHYYGDSYDMSYGGQYGQYYGFRHFMQTPMEMYHQIQYVMKDMYAMFEKMPVYDHQMMYMQMHRFTQMVGYMLHQLERFEHIDAVQQVIYHLRDVYMSMQRFTPGSALMDAHQMKMQLYQHVQTVLIQLEKMYMLVQGDMQSELYYVVKMVFHHFLYGLYDFYYQMHGYGYGMNKYDQWYGMGSMDQYGKWYGSMGDMDYKYGMGGMDYKYGMGYGYGKMGYGYGRMGYDTMHHNYMPMPAITAY